MFKQFYPDQWLESTYDIDFQTLKEEGIRAVIFDIDNTLVPHGVPADERAITLFTTLSSLGIKSVLLSNNKEPRVKSFFEQVSATAYIFKASKPSVKNYKKAMEMMESDEKSTIFVGDQLFTDVWGAKRAGIRNILVKPIHPKEEIQIVLKRKLERVVLYFYRKDLAKQHKND